MVADAPESAVREAGRPQADRSASFHDRLAPSYGEELTRWRGDVWARSAFHDLVRRTVPPPGRLLDFGCGTGIDAAYYAGQGYEVVAYDNSTGMAEVLKRRLEDEIGRGAVEPVSVPYETFLGRVLPSSPEFDGVAANFAVVNLIADPKGLFDALAARVVAGGWLIVNVLNPFFWREAVVPARWPAWLEAWRSGSVHQRNDQLDTYRHTAGTFERLAAPGWTLVRRRSVGAFLRHHSEERDCDWSRPRSWAERVDVRWGERFPVRALGRFLFLAFQRTA